jgi:hypothetical protein
MEYNCFGDKRLNKRYSKMVNQSMQHSQTTSAGLIILLSEQSGFATTQAVWRFFANEKTTPQRLVDPLRQFAKQKIEHSRNINQGLRQSSLVHLFTNNHSSGQLICL